MPPGPTGMPPLPDMLARLTRASVGLDSPDQEDAATGVGSEPGSGQRHALRQP